MDRCPLCLGEQGSCKKRSDGFGEKLVAVSSIPIVFLANCSSCGGEYNI